MKPLKNVVPHIRGSARKLGIARYRWYSEHFVQIEAALSGRFEAIRAGADPPSVEDLLDSLWVSDPKPYWSTHRPRQGRNYEKFVKLVAEVDRRAIAARGDSVP
jgi:hypothetical protein